ncbi:MAG: nucleotidyltransferase domain-containing protein [Lachnospiraceae bacterium]|nr:nucleotidyltransferase domain-containing protein [Lachnospiraceae bacterium]
MVDTDPAYSFLKTDEHLKNRIMFLTLGGSYAYGTNVETSDVDVRGCALNRPSDILGLTNFEQRIDAKTDTTVYAFNKLIPLVLNCNPNTIEMFGCKPEHYLVISDIGKEFIDNRHMFLSQRAVHSFGGYADKQLRRLENALARDKMSQAMKEEHICGSMIAATSTFKDGFSDFKDESIKLYTDVSEKEGLDREVYIDFNLQHFPVRSLNSIMNELSNILKTYDKLTGRNHKKDDLHLNKHAMHLIRLYLMCIDLLETGEIVTYREKDIEFLLKIRNGLFQNDDGTYRSEFFDIVNDCENRMKYAKENTPLPKEPDFKKVEEFVMEVNRKAINL